MKKIICTVLLSLVLVVAGLSAAAVATAAQTNQLESYLKTESFSAYLTDFHTGTLLYENNADEKHEIASMTKIMTLLLVFEEIENGTLRLQDDVVISETAAKTGGSTMFLDRNSTHKVDGLLRGIVIASANDAAVAMSEKIAGSEDAFVARMNARAAELGMENTHFANCTGLPKENQHSTAKDVNKMTRALVAYDGYHEYAKIWLEDYVHPSGRVSQLANTNKLVRFYEGCDGGKTGYTDQAKHCLSASAMREDMRVVATVIGAPDSKARFRDVSKMFDYAFANFENKLVVKAGENLIEEIKIAKSKDDVYEIGVTENIYTLSKKAGGEVTTQIELNDALKAPIKAGEKVGTIKVLKDGETVREADLVALKDIKKASLWDSIQKIVKEW